jgi:hypothetical protein
VRLEYEDRGEWSVYNGKTGRGLGEGHEKRRLLEKAQNGDSFNGRFV